MSDSRLVRYTPEADRRIARAIKNVEQTMPRRRHTWRGRSTLPWGPIVKIWDDVEGYTQDENGLTSEEWGGYNLVDADLFLPNFSDDDEFYGYEQFITEDESPIKVINATPYDLKADEECFVVELSGYWVIVEPVHDVLVDFELTEDLTATGLQADADVWWGTEKIKIVSGDLTTGKKLASGTNGWAKRKKDGYFIVSTFKCEVSA